MKTGQTAHVAASVRESSVLEDPRPKGPGSAMLPMHRSTERSTRTFFLPSRLVHFNRGSPAKRSRARKALQHLPHHCGKGRQRTPAKGTGLTTSGLRNPCARSGRVQRPRLRSTYSRPGADRDLRTHLPRHDAIAAIKAALPALGPLHGRGCPAGERGRAPLPPIRHAKGLRRFLRTARIHSGKGCSQQSHRRCIRSCRHSGRPARQMLCAVSYAVEV